jgi:tellurite resistance protein TehA-like permease
MIYLLIWFGSGLLSTIILAIDERIEGTPMVEVDTTLWFLLGPIGLILYLLFFILELTSKINVLDKLRKLIRGF